MAMKKFFIGLCLLAVSTFVYSQNQTNNHQMMHQQLFNQFKQIRIDGIQQRITIEQTALSCFQSAQDKEAMKACGQTARSAMQNLKQSQQQKIQALKQTMQQQRQQNTGVNHPAT
jgi:hypothetical protein